jgi:hypothetical protein
MVFYTLWIHLRNLFGFNQNVGRVLLDRTLSCFAIDFVMLISLMYCERLILWIQPYSIPFFECELDAGGTIHFVLLSSCSTCYGNQFSAAIGYLTITIDEFLAL